MRPLSRSALAVLLCVVALLIFAGNVYSFTKVERISKEALNALLDDPETIIIDLRLEIDWQKSNGKIRGAVHEDPLADEASWAGKYPKEKNIILYCA